MKRLVPRVITSAVGILLILTAFVARPGAGDDTAWLVRAFDYVDLNFSIWFNILDHVVRGLEKISELLFVHS